MAPPEFALFYPFIGIVLVVYLITQSVRIFREYERGMVFTLGRFQEVKGPGLVPIVPYAQQVVRVDLRTVVFPLAIDLLAGLLDFHNGKRNPEEKR